MRRRPFLQTLAAASALQGLRADSPLALTRHLTLLHTNDTHSRLEPYGPGNGKLSGLGGMARRATLVKRLREELPAVLLLDAGDTFQGTPYFNKYRGALDYQLMRMVGYDAGTLGNHDFDNGVDALVEAMQSMENLKHKHPPITFLNCNFTTEGAPALASRLHPWMVKEIGGLRVGLTGVGVEFDGLVAPTNHKGLGWTDPVRALKPIVAMLRDREKVDAVIVISHLGYDRQGEAIDDLNLAKLVPNIDVIIGGHSHTFLDQPTSVGSTKVFQVGHSGVNLGRMDLTFSKGQLRASTGRSMAVEA
jgi:5'-nucleotidase